MEIESTTFGAITIDGKTYAHDVIIRLSGDVVKRRNCRRSTTAPRTWSRKRKRSSSSRRAASRSFSARARRAMSSCRRKPKPISRKRAARFCCSRRPRQSVCLTARMPRRLGFFTSHALCGLCIGNGTIHEFDPEQIEPIAGYQMIFSGTPWCCDSDALDDGQQPGPISIGADKLQRVTKVTKIGSERRHFARSSAPDNIFGHNAPIDPCFRWSRKAIWVDSRDEAQESPIAFPPRLTGCWCKVRATAAFIKPVPVANQIRPYW